MAQITIGVDISKEALDAYRFPDGESRRFPNAKQGHKALIAWIGTMRPASSSSRPDLITPPSSRPSPRQACPSSRSTRARRAVSPRPPASSRRPIAWTPRSSPAWERCSSSIRARPPPGRAPASSSFTLPAKPLSRIARPRRTEQKPRPHHLETPERRAAQPHRTPARRRRGRDRTPHQRGRSGAVAVRFAILVSHPGPSLECHRLHLADRNAR